MTDVHTLVVLPDGNLVWSNCDSPAPSDHMPQGVRIYNTAGQGHAGGVIGSASVISKIQACNPNAIDLLCSPGQVSQLIVDASCL
jgi:hypothetical protein